MQTEYIRGLVLKYREIILYLIFGVLTTIVNYIAYIVWTSAFPGKHSNVSATVIASVVAVAFAYFTNRGWVFKSKAEGHGQKLKECGAFFAGRMFSGAIDLAIMYTAVDVMLFDGRLVKLLSNILVIITNYVLSKFFVFKESKGR